MPIVSFSVVIEQKQSRHLIVGLLWKPPGASSTSVSTAWAWAPEGSACINNSCSSSLSPRRKKTRAATASWTRALQDDSFTRRAWNKASEQVRGVFSQHRCGARGVGDKTKKKKKKSSRRTKCERVCGASVGDLGFQGHRLQMHRLMFFCIRRSRDSLYLCAGEDSGEYLVMRTKERGTQEP